VASRERPELFEVVFQRHYDSLRRFAQRRIGDAAGEEVAARAFLMAFERRASFDRARGSAKSWLYGIAANLIRHHIRDEHTHLRILGGLPRESTISNSDDEERLIALGVWPALAEELRLLAPDDRETFLLLALGDLSYAQIAEALQIPIGTVRSRIHRVRHSLRERLRRLGAIANDENDEGATPDG